jgi:copper chaperone
MQTITLTAPDISCDHCKHAIEEAVGALPGVSAVSVAIDPKKVSIEYDPASVTLAQIKETMDEEGYPVA